MILVRVGFAAAWGLVAAAAIAGTWAVLRAAELMRRVFEQSVNVRGADDVERLWLDVSAVQAWIEPCAVVATTGAVALLAAHAALRVASRGPAQPTAAESVSTSLGSSAR